MKNIPSAGPWITKKEIDYVTDAVANGWYENWSGYLDKFEKSFADYLGLKHAIATTSCTGALHIMLKALGIGPGDEVLVPESTWIASVSCVDYVGASPVFVDIEEDTWCINPEDIRKKITNKTKAIIPVHMYGHPADMVEISKIANEFGLKIIEDAAPSIGSKIGDQLTGTFGLGAGFSFQGAKPIVTGEGGMLVTNDDNFYDKCFYYWDHCRKKGEVLFNDNYGLKYKMSNIQAALGLAQLERIDEIIKKRRQIFFWYKRELNENKFLRLNVERKGTFNNYYVPTIILNSDFQKNAAEVMHELSANGVQNRPFFRCISKMMGLHHANTPVADFIASHGINLPCATTAAEEDIVYVSNIINKIIS